MFEIVPGCMSILRIGPVTVPLQSMARIAMKSEMLLVLRRPRLEIRAAPPGVNMKCEIEDIWIGENRPDVSFSDNQDSLGIIQPGEKIQAILVNHMSQNVNVCVVVEGDAVRTVHWATECSNSGYGGCPSCRWRTDCHHRACERSPEEASSCAKSRESAYVQSLASNSPSAGSSTSTSMWRPWNPLNK